MISYSKFQWKWLPNLNVNSNVIGEFMKITSTLNASLLGIDKRKTILLELGKAMLEAYNRSMFPVDLMALGAIKRTISTMAGLKLLIQATNMVCTRTILRVQIDTALRFFAIFCVDDPHLFSTEVLSGKQINKMQDSRGKFMSDSYLVSRLSNKYPWLPRVYKNLSGYIHFSNSHLFHPIQEVDDESRTIKFEIQEEDEKYPEESWLEVVNCFNESVDIFIKYLEGWIFTKDNPELVQRLRKLEESTA